MKGLESTSSNMDTRHIQKHRSELSSYDNPVCQGKKNEDTEVTISFNGGAGEEINNVRNDINGKPIQDSAPKPGCMMCVKRIQIETFDQDSIKPGDHIQTKGQKKCCGKVYTHHAIVDTVEITSSGDGNRAKISVIDVPNKKDKLIVEHELKVNDDVEIHCKDIKRIDYRRRKHDQSVTKKRAVEFLNKCNEPKDKYSLMMRNCEHFVLSCVNGQVDIEAKTLSKSTSSQGVACFWRTIHIIIAFLQCTCLTLNIFIFANFVKSDQRFSWMSGMKFCYQENGRRMLQTWCDWATTGILLVLFAVLGCVLFCCPSEVKCNVCGSCVRPIYLRKINYICKKCLNARRVEYASKILLFFAFDFINIFSEKPLYEAIHEWKEGFIILVCIVIVTAETVFIYNMAPLMTFCLFKHVYKGEHDHSDYLMNRGLLWWCRRCCKDRHCCTVHNG